MTHSALTSRSPHVIIFSTGFASKKYDRLDPYLKCLYLYYCLVYQRVHCNLFRSIPAVYPMIYCSPLKVQFQLYCIFQYCISVVQLSSNSVYQKKIVIYFYLLAVVYCWYKSDIKEFSLSMSVLQTTH